MSYIESHCLHEIYYHGQIFLLEKSWFLNFMLPAKRLEHVQRSMNVQAFIASESDALSFQQNVKLGDNGGNPQTVAQWDTKPSQIETNVYF